MSIAASSATVSRSGWFRLGWRAPLLILHVLLGVLLAIGFFHPVGRRIRLAGEPLTDRLLRWWSRALLRCFGLRLIVRGSPHAGPCLFVANHHSWLDIEVLHACRAVRFIAKAEIARWPLVGWLATRAGTLYHRRGSAHSLAEVMREAVTCLKRGEAVAVFPEGSTGPSDRVRVFHPRIFQIAIDAGVPVQPVALRFVRAGEVDHALPFRPGESFLANALRLLRQPPLTAELDFLAPIPSDEPRDRLAQRARLAIAQSLGVPLVRR
ncbi:MAG: 1-acyl-sn-glycerol-3-phosphate acyltransferase [Lysobacterales bacterium]|jgi:1-acyl-sn-glycerol-3-phosphate acyltransferase|nr:MAG: 1-acyl-sn-glycerol-3-phosphate acyltransferase [Xanthomonadales bacterium]